MSDATSIDKAPDPVRQVIEWVLCGYSETEITEAIKATWPSAKVKPLIISALTKLSKQASPDPDLLRGFCIEATRLVYRKALEANDHSSALRALKMLMELAR